MGEKFRINHYSIHDAQFVRLMKETLIINGKGRKKKTKRNSNLWKADSTFLIILLSMCFLAIPVQGALYSGGGTEADPYIIDTAAKMNDIGNNP